MSGASSPDKDKVTLDLVLTSRGDCTGTITFDRAEIDYRQVDGTTYVQGNVAPTGRTPPAAQAAQQVLSVMGDKWARLPESGAGPATFCDIATS